MPLCDVPDCPAAAMPLNRYCPLHQDADRAWRVGATKHPCARCRRTIARDDYVRRKMVPQVVTRKGQAAARWQHAACVPPVPSPRGKRAREAPKPLLEGL
jgi:hypothetical protein